MKFHLLGLLLLASLLGSPTRAEEGPVCPKTETLSRASFPEGFIIGTATASYQVYIIYIYAETFYKSITFVCYEFSFIR